jgi:hypothetical protein
MTNKNQIEKLCNTIETNIDNMLNGSTLSIAKYNQYIEILETEINKDLTLDPDTLNVSIFMRQTIKSFISKSQNHYTYW